MFGPRACTVAPEKVPGQAWLALPTKVVSGHGHHSRVLNWFWSKLKCLLQVKRDGWLISHGMPATGPACSVRWAVGTVLVRCRGGHLVCPWEGGRFLGREGAGRRSPGSCSGIALCPSQGFAGWTQWQVRACVWLPGLRVRDSREWPIPWALGSGCRPLFRSAVTGEPAADCSRAPVSSQGGRSGDFTLHTWGSSYRSEWPDLCEVAGPAG